MDCFLSAKLGLIKNMRFENDFDKFKSRGTSLSNVGNMHACNVCRVNVKYFLTA